MEYKMVTVPAEKTKIIEVTIKNNYSAALYYGAWYEITSGVHQILFQNCIPQKIVQPAVAA